MVSFVISVLKFQDFSVTQNFREINFVGKFGSRKSAFFSNLGAVNFVYLANFSLQKVQKLYQVKI